MAKIKDINHIPGILKNIKKINNTIIAVGIIGDGESEIATYAAANEFGTRKAGRNRKVVIPERSWLRSTFDDKTKTNDALKHTDDVFNPKFNAKVAVNRVGAVMVGHVQEKIASNIPPKNAQVTINKKKSSKTLVDKGTMRQAISFEVKK